MKPDYILFPDGSVSYRKQTKEFNSSFACCILNVHTYEYTIISGTLSKNSSTYCESWGIYKGLQYIKRICKKNSSKPSILVVSDSKIAVESLTTYVKHKWDITDWFDWRKTNNEPVQNQDIYRRILTIIMEEGFKTKFIHINSHTDKEKKSQTKKISNKLQKGNILVNKSVIDLFVGMNDIADKRAQAITKLEKNSNTPTLKRKTIGDHKNELKGVNR